MVLLVRYGFSDVAALTQHDRAIGHLHHVLEVVGDEDHRKTVVGSLLDQSQDVARFPCSEGRGRLVEDHDALAEGHRPGARDGLPLTAGHQADLHVLLHVDLQTLEQLVGLFGHRAVVDPAKGMEPARVGRLTSGIEVRDRIEIVEQRKVLVHGLDSQTPGLHWRIDRDLVAADQDLALVGAHHATEDLDQGRLAGAVVPEQGENLTLGELQRHVVQRQRRAVALVQPLHLERRPAVGALALARGITRTGRHG